MTKLYFYLILYILLNYKYATTYFYNLYYVTTFPLTSYQPYYYSSPPLHVHLYLTYFLYTLSLYISPIYTMCIAYLPHMHFPLTQLPYTYYHNYYLDYLFILKNVLFTILILLYFVNITLNVQQCKNWIFVNKHIHTHIYSCTH